MTNERIKNEKVKYDKKYTDLLFAVNDLKQILDDKELNKRVFTRKVDTLSNYIQFLNNIEKEEAVEDKKGLFSKMFKKGRNIDSEINSYLDRDKRENIEKLNCCINCKCINCVAKCPFSRCINCRELEYTYNCDKEKFTFTKSSDKVTLYQDDEEFIFDVKGYLIEKQEDETLRRYVYLVDVKDKDNQHLLEYSKFKGEENYSSVIEGDDASRLEDLYEKFIEMGLSV